MTAPHTKLIPLAHHHAETLFGLIDEARGFLSTWLDWVDRLHGQKDLDRFVADALLKTERGRERHFLIAADDKPVGLASLTDIADATAAIGYWVAQAEHRRDIATAALRDVKWLAFDTLALQTLRLEYLEGDAATREVAECCGFLRVHPPMSRSSRLHGRLIDRHVSLCRKAGQA